MLLPYCVLSALIFSLLPISVSKKTKIHEPRDAADKISRDDTVLVQEKSLIEIAKQHFSNPKMVEELRQPSPKSDDLHKPRKETSWLASAPAEELPRQPPLKAERPSGYPESPSGTGRPPPPGWRISLTEPFPARKTVQQSLRTRIARNMDDDLYPNLQMLLTLMAKYATQQPKEYVNGTIKTNECYVAMSSGLIEKAIKERVIVKECEFRPIFNTISFKTNEAEDLSITCMHKVPEYKAWENAVFGNSNVFKTATYFSCSNFEVFIDQNSDINLETTQANRQKTFTLLKPADLLAHVIAVDSFRSSIKTWEQLRIQPRTTTRHAISDIKFRVVGKSGKAKRQAVVRCSLCRRHVPTHYSVLLAIAVLSQRPNQNLRIPKTGIIRKLSAAVQRLRLSPIRSTEPLELRAKTVFYKWLKKSPKMTLDNEKNFPHTWSTPVVSALVVAPNRLNVQLYVLREESKDDFRMSEDAVILEIKLGKKAPKLLADVGFVVLTNRFQLYLKRNNRIVLKERSFTNRKKML